MRILDLLLIFPLFVGALGAPMDPPPPQGLWQRLEGWTKALNHSLDASQILMNITIYMPLEQRVGLALYFGSEIFEADDLSQFFPNIETDIAVDCTSKLRDIQGSCGAGCAAWDASSDSRIGSCACDDKNALRDVYGQW